MLFFWSGIVVLFVLALLDTIVTKLGKGQTFFKVLSGICLFIFMMYYFLIFIGLVISSQLPLSV